MDTDSDLSGKLGVPVGVQVESPRIEYSEEEVEMNHMIGRIEDLLKIRIEPTNERPFERLKKDWKGQEEANGATKAKDEV